MADEREASSAVLAGLRVVDLSQTIPGAQASQLFADFGADVVHVEPPGGSPLRSQAAYPFWARGKQCIVLDLSAPTDAAIARNLAIGADVVLETWRPGVAERLGLGYDRLAAANPGLIYGSVTGFGRAGPYADLQGYEGIVCAAMGTYSVLSGMARRKGPAFHSVPYASYPSAQLLAQGVLAALYERESSGLGQRVETSLVQGLSVHDTFNWHSRVLAKRYSQGFSQSPLEVDSIPSGGLSFRLLIALTKDGRWLQFSQTAQRLFVAMMRAFELDWMFADPKWASAPDFDDVPTRVEFWEALLDTVRSKTAAEWLTIFDQHPDVWGEMFRGGADVLDHPQVRFNESVAEVEDPVRGRIRQPGTVVRVLGRPPVELARCPDLDEHGATLRLRAQTPAPRPSTSGEASTSTRRPPLDGVTCLELGTYYAAPFGATLLAELGARVIKVEQLDGDPMRGMLPFPEIAGIKALQGKESVAVDFHSARGHEIVLRLVRGADIVLQSFRAGVAERLGLDASSLRVANPDLVYLNAPGYGVGGPCGHRPAYAPTIGAGAGIAFRNAGSIIREAPDLDMMEVRRSAMQLAKAVMGVGNADGLSSVTVGTALCLGLLARRRGAGAHDLLTTMMSSTAHALSETMVLYEGQPSPPTADGGLHGFSATYRLYEADGDWVFLAAPSERDWAALSSALAGSPALGDDPRFATAEARREHDDELVSALAARLATRPAGAWERDLRAAGVACVACAVGPVEANYMDEGSVGQQCGLVTTCHHALLDEHERLTPLVTMSRSAGVAGGAPLCGDQTAAVLAELGFDDAAVAVLVADGVVSVGG